MLRPAVLLLVAGCGGAEAPVDDAARRARVEAMYAEYRADFPEVRSVDLAALAELEGEREIVFVDVRTAEEVEVSRIPGALTREEFEAAADDLRDATVVTYCTVGYRSGLYAEDLRQRGYDVFNLEGSVLAWTHGGRPLVDGQGETRRVHVYGAEWDLAAGGYESVW